MRKIIAALIRCVLTFKLLSFLASWLEPYMKDGAIIFPTDTNTRTRVAIVVLVTFVVFIYGMVWAIRLFFRVIGYIYGLIFRRGAK